MILKGSVLFFSINRCINLPASYPPFSTSNTIDDIGGSDKLHSSSSLSTPSNEISSGILILLSLHVSAICNAKLSSQANNAIGLGNEISQSSSSIRLCPHC